MNGSAAPADAASVALHLIDLDLLPEAVAVLSELLDPEERTRAAAFRSMPARRRFIVRRARTRELLAAQAGCAPDALSFVRNPFGKPALEGSNWRFSLSHSGDLACLAVADGVEVGCDIERHDPALATRDVAERFFTPAEQDALASFEREAWTVAFFNCWSRKEAFVKGLGQGLSYPLDRFDVTLGEPARLARGGSGWAMVAFTPAPGYSGAVVARAGAIRIS